jgi:hypothetical protein
VGRKLYVVGLISALSISVSSFAFAQGRPQSFGARKGVFNRHNGQFKGAARERWFQLSPEDRQTFRKNAERWLQMSPEERKVMRDREILRRERIRNEAEAVLRDSGLRLDQTKRDLFQERYLQERARIDRELRQEYETRRQQQLERLKKEFQPPESSPGVPSTSTPAISTSPSH